ncbi:hypothetical protein BCR34DRAFT_586079 [Clohesyomyces aquaticus]|uniref:Heterokaryon incompatibility domain-containing protein n=1 Tax=Clohesyomyces aquaticus TaxID=1231657 RepID=A0A1Y1ZV10_9PLEO|nr:hypothetical protein BCR34DRAFT_586079 [Clohesyomyces aquaticus]
MDLVPTPFDSVAGYDETPLLDIIPYDFGRFSTFPHRNGFPSKSSITQEKCGDRLSVLLQSWMFFGVIAEYSGQPVDLNQWTGLAHNGISRRVVRFQPINTLIRNHDVAKKKRVTLLREVFKYLKTFQKNCHYENISSPFSEILLSVRFLLCALAQLSELDLKPTGLDPFVQRNLVKSGWCPSQVKQIEELNDDAVAYYLLRLRKETAADLSHQNCPDTHCTASNVGKDYNIRHTHKTRSGTGADTTCEPVYIDKYKIREIISQGKIPLVSVHTAPNQGIQLRVRVAKANDRFIAFSHVWADGLGNPHANALAKCELQRLDYLLRSLPHPSVRFSLGEIRGVYSLGPLSLDLARCAFTGRKKSRPRLFWLDTLCIPVGEDEISQDLKQKAINMMALIYSQASQVLILDSGLEKSRVGALSKTELLARINFSRWMGRCWTLQEGALSPYSYFQCADGAINVLDVFPSSLRKLSRRCHYTSLTLSDLRSSVRARWFSPRSSGTMSAHDLSITDMLEDTIYATLYCSIRNSMHISAHMTDSQILGGIVDKRAGHWTPHLVAIWNALARRSTTKNEDLPAILANLLGFHPYRVMQLPVEERLAAMLCSGDNLPLSLLYNTGPKLNQGLNSRNRWVPKFLSRSILKDEPVMEFDETRNLILNSGDIPGEQEPIVWEIDQGSSSVITDGSRYWNVKYIRPEDDTLDSHGYPITIVMKDRKGSEGACIKARRTEKTTFKAIYDCPCIIEPYHKSSSPSLDLQASKCLFLDRFQIAILTDAATLPQALPRVSRVAPSLMAPNTVQWALKLLRFWVIPMSIFYTIPICLRIYIAHDEPWSGLSNLGRVSLTFFAIQRIPSPLMPVPIAPILFLIDRWRRLKCLDIVYVVFDFVWILAGFVMISVLIQQWVQYQFEVQLANCKEDWEPEIKIPNQWVRFRKWAVAKKSQW